MRLIASYRVGTILGIFKFLACECSTLQTELIDCEKVSNVPLSFSRHWTSLGPFRIGTREALWGSDPLEAYGGFANIPYERSSVFPSSLSTNASVAWSTDVQRTSSNGTSVTLHLRTGYPDIDWEAQQRVYGWAALQYQTWTRGYLFNHGLCTQRALLRLSGILEFHLNGEHFFGGDFYGFDRAPILVRLQPGRNQLDIRLIRDVRAMGGNVPPVVESDLRCDFAAYEILTDVSRIVAPDLVDGRLPSRYFGIPLTNLLEQTLSVVDCDDAVANPGMRLLRSNPILVLQGQTRVVTLFMENDPTSPDINVSLCYYQDAASNEPALQRHIVSFRLDSRRSDEAHKYTFLHPSGAVSYAVLKPPRRNSNRLPAKPLMVLLHGAGLEAGSYQVRHSLDEMPDLEAFALFPTGMSPWSADDWHIWGHADIVAAIDAVHDWIRQMEWNGTSVTTEQVLVAGHSNGGQGTWFFASHMPDRTLAAAPLSGYTSIENYVPYSYWSEADPLKLSIVSTARVSYKNELFIGNLADIPILQQHGSADDNVPPYHSRLMSSLRAKLGGQSQYVELLNQGHWFDGAMTTKPLQDFYTAQISGNGSARNMTRSFSIVSTATDEMGPKHGILVEQLHSPDRLGNVHVDIDYDADMTVRWHIVTTNVRRLRLSHFGQPTMWPKSVKLDQIEAAVDVPVKSMHVCFFHAANGKWSVQACDAAIGERTGRQRGGLDAIMRTTDCFQILASKGTTSLALQISRNMLQYFGADSLITRYEDRVRSIRPTSNVITLSLAQGTEVPPSSLPDFPITFTEFGIRLCPRLQLCQMLPFHLLSGALMLRPLPEERLEVLVWGTDLTGLQTAARLLPSLTGSGQPDFVVLGPDARWRGVQGALALGFFDYSWNISQASYV